MFFFKGDGTYVDGTDHTGTHDEKYFSVCFAGQYCSFEAWKYFSVPAGVSPNNHVLSSVNKAEKELSTTSEYTLFPLYCTIISTFSIVTRSSQLKKASFITTYLEQKSSFIQILYAMQAHLLPWILRKFRDKKIFEDVREKYCIFTSTFSTAFSPHTFHRTY